MLSNSGVALPDNSAVYSADKPLSRKTANESMQDKTDYSQGQFQPQNIDSVLKATLQQKNQSAKRLGSGKSGKDIPFNPEVTLGDPEIKAVINNDSVENLKKPIAADTKQSSAKKADLQLSLSNSPMHPKVLNYSNSASKDSN